MTAHYQTRITQEFFDSYRALCWCAGQPLAVLHQKYDEGADTGLYQHADFYALYVIRGGRGLHMINDHPFPIRAGNVYITPPGSVVGYRDYRALRAEAFCFQAQLFTDEELDALSALPGFHDIIIQGKGPHIDKVDDYHLHLTPTQYQVAEQLVDEIFTEMRCNETVSPVIVRGLMFRLLVYLARVRGEAANAGLVEPRATGVLALADVLQICESRFAEGLTVPQLAALAFLSPSHFSEIFTREVGQPPATYLRGLRLARAQTLLRTTSQSITDIAQQSGFGDSAQLSRAFKATLGITPRDYRGRFRL